jgi:hypothetical protein
MTVVLYVLLVALTVELFCRWLERRDWNDGYCPHCLKEWEYFDTDSQANDGYVCRGCDKTIWLGRLLGSPHDRLHR